MYCDRRIFRALPRGQLCSPHPRVLRRGDCHDDHRSLVELRCRLMMYSRTADIAYRPARPILMNRGPVPFSRDLASQEWETPSSLATWAGCNRGSTSLGFVWAIMAPLLPICRRSLTQGEKASQGTNRNQRGLSGQINRAGAEPAINPLQTI